jgi:hypothetical protein
LKSLNLINHYKIPGLENTINLGHPFVSDSHQCTANPVSAKSQAANPSTGPVPQELIKMIVPRHLDNQIFKVRKEKKF